MSTYREIKAVVGFKFSLVKINRVFVNCIHISLLVVYSHFKHEIKLS